MASLSLPAKNHALQAHSSLALCMKWLKTAYTFQRSVSTLRHVAIAPVEEAAATAPSWQEQIFHSTLPSSGLELPGNDVLRGERGCSSHFGHAFQPSTFAKGWSGSLGLQVTRQQSTIFNLASTRGALGCGIGSRCFSSSPQSKRAGESEDEFWARGGGFDPAIPVESAWTPPSGWYTSAAVMRAEIERVFSRGWQVVGNAVDVAKPGQYLTGSIGATRYVVARDERGKLRAFHNVCRHHAAAVASGKTGCADAFVCPYHGWTYGLDGRLRKATRLAGIKDFAARDFGLVSIPKVAIWGHFVLLSLEKGQAGGAADGEGSEAEERVGREWLGDAEADVQAIGTWDPLLKHVATREYAVPCNWKVYVDNYLDGGYHVPFAHPGLTTDIDMKSYRTQLFERVSFQTASGSQTGESTTGVATAEGDGPLPSPNVPRIGDSVAYVLVYPNFAINRYGPWLETNRVLPLTVDSCMAVFDWFLDERSGKVGDTAYLETCLAASDQVQAEDESLCAMVQAGLTSPAYDVGRYAPSVELGMHHHHCLLHKDLSF